MSAALSTAVILDLAVLAVVLCFTALGAKKGFVLTLCSLAAALVALWGASLISDLAAPMVADALQPRLEDTIQSSLDQRIEEWASSGVQVEGETAAQIIETGISQTVLALRDRGGILAWAADLLERNSEDLKNAISSALSGALDGGISSAISSVAANLASQVARGLIFLVSFFVLLILWGIASHVLDLVTKLPVLNQLNHTLGGALGLVQGLVIAYACAWVLYRFTGLVTADMAAGSRLFVPLASLDPLAYLFPP